MVIQNGFRDGKVMWRSSRLIYILNPITEEILARDEKLAFG